MKILKFVNGVLEANCYAIDDGNSIVLIDVGCFSDQIKKYVTENANRIVYILQTHRHFDHICGVNEVKELIGTKVAISREDECGLYSDKCSLRALYPDYYAEANPNLRADLLLSDSDILEISTMSFRVIATPGHTVGSVSFLLNDKYLFSGDTLFAGSIGRTDLDTSDFDSMQQSLSKLKQLPDATVVYPGHGPETTIGSEKKENIYFRV